jgi:4-phospho-D-threonate 3-dehydrogenase / 4-phospho-D-erythronate 3-dehydrogenase
MMAADTRRPLLALTTGDPAGVGPEVILKALQDHTVFGECRPVVIGDIAVLQRAQAALGDHGTLREVTDLTSAGREAGRIDVLAVPRWPGCGGARSWR